MTRDDYKSKATGIFAELDKDDPIETKIRKKSKSKSITKPQSKKDDVRLHVFLRHDLNQRLEDEVYKRKKAAVKKKDITKRHLIEELIEKNL
jgi:hypothetical protein